MEPLYNYLLQKETHIGLLRSNQEDALLSLVHPEDDNIKLLGVADGMGGKQYGDMAANFVLEKFGYWFLEKTKDMFYDVMKLKCEMLDLIMECNHKLLSDYGKNQVGTTLSLVLVLLDQTIILHLGDSRVYFYKNENLLQVTEDDSDVWLYYKYQHIDKEWLRYFSTSNIIHNCVGVSLETCRPHIYIYPNVAYETLLVMTDGITDLITDSKIQRIFREEKTKNIAKRLVHEAVFVNQNLFIPGELKKLKLDNYTVPVQGRDNASVVLFSKF